MIVTRWISFCIFFISSGFVIGQTEIQVFNEELEALPFVEVYTSNFEFSTLADEDGKVQIPEKLKDNQLIVFNFLGYQQASYTVEKLKENPKVILQQGLVLEEILMVGRTDNQSRDLPGKVESINSKIFKLTNPQTTADALAQHSDVYIQRSQMGGGSPIVRGFEANKVLLVLDGVRMNNAIYRSGHLQNAITVDNAVLERLEVLYGPGSLIYGSDAIGGVVHFRSKNPQLNFDPSRNINFFGNAYVRYATANKEKSTHLDLNIGTSKFGSFSSISFSDYDDLRTGSKRSEEFPDFGKRLIYADRENGEDIIVANPNPNIQIGTGYSQVDMMQKFLFQPSEKLRMIANFQYSQSSDIPRYDALSELDGDGLSFAEWYYGPQKRLLSSLRTDITQESMFFDKIILIGAYQKIDEDRIDRQFNSTNLDRQEEDVDIFSFTADLHKYLDSNQTLEINYGAEFNYNDLSSTAFRTDITDGSISNTILTRYPSGGSSTNNLGAYALVKKELKNLDLFGGLRYSRNRLNVRYNLSDNLPWPKEYYDGVSANNSALSWSIGTAYSHTNGLKLSSQISSAFRSPNIDDLAKIRVKATEISVPNLDLKPETSLNAELNISQQIGNRLIVSATGFITTLENAIVRDNFTLPDGSIFLLDEGDTLTTIANINANQARVRGISINATSSLTKSLKLSGSINYIKGQRKNTLEEESPLAHIPPVYGKFTVSYEKNAHQFSLKLRYNGEKPLDEYGGSEDNLENATINGTPGWYTINAYYLKQVSQHISVSASLENILDVHYRPFASGVSAPGRNVIVSLNASF
ncbi:MAG: TonB-dependent receptor [Saprospiraceae bacterium]|nr:TonB-dependent receptor [Saprospiraceae bacterium]